jgi:hypothetical protein
MVAIGAGLAMWARAGVLTYAPIDEPQAVQQRSCEGIGVHCVSFVVEWPVRTRFVWLLRMLVTARFWDQSRKLYNSA